MFGARLAIGRARAPKNKSLAEYDNMDVSLTSVEVEVTVTLEGNPLIATHAKVRVAVETADPSRANSIIHRAREISTVSNSLKRGVPVEFSGGP